MINRLYTITKRIAFIFFLAAITCCSSVKTADYTVTGSFTDGIEGPATDNKGNIYAVNYLEQGTIGKVTPEGVTSLFVKLPEGSIGNGIRFNKKNEMFIADYTNHNILKVDMLTQKIEVFAHNAKANQPNDLSIAPNGTIYASDPNWSNNTGNIWMVTKDKGFVLLESGMGTTNGIEVSVDGKKLYVNESIQRKIWVYDIKQDGSVTNKKEFCSFDNYGLDGMRFNKNGNLYLCRYDKGTVAVLSPKGKLLKEIQLKGKKPTNITFSPDYKLGYVTIADRGCIEVFQVN